MRIGELAGIVGVSARAVRHYHHIGLLPEPRRRVNGYRDYGWRDLVQLARLRRLTALGLNLDEARDVLADDAGGDLHTALAGLDADLARQETDLRERRARLAVLLEQARTGTLPADGPLSPELTTLFARLASVPTAQAGTDERDMAARDREVLTLLDTTVPEGVRKHVIGLVGSLGTDPEEAERLNAVYALMDGLVKAEPDDPSVEAAAAAIVDGLPEKVLRCLAEAERAGDFDIDDSGFLDALCASLAPAQAEALRRAMRRIVRRVEQLS